MPKVAQRPDFTIRRNYSDKGPQYIIEQGKRPKTSGVNRQFVVDLPHMHTRLLSDSKYFPECVRYEFIDRHVIIHAAICGTLCVAFGNMENFIKELTELGKEWGCIRT